MVGIVANEISALVDRNWLFVVVGAFLPKIAAPRTEKAVTCVVLVFTDTARKHQRMQENDGIVVWIIVDVGAVTALVGAFRPSFSLRCVYFSFLVWMVLLACDTSHCAHPNYISFDRTFDAWNSPGMNLSCRRPCGWCHDTLLKIFCQTTMTHSTMPIRPSNNRRPSWRQSPSLPVLILLLIVCTTTLPWTATASSSSLPTTASGKGLILRVRLENGSMEKVLIKSGSEETTTLKQVLGRFERSKGSVLKLGTSTTASTVIDEDKTLTALGLSNGALITVKGTSTTTKDTSSSGLLNKVTKSSSFQPFPELAKDYTLAVRQQRRKQGGMSYADLAKIQSALHLVEPQPEGPLKRLYMCATSAERFQSNCVLTATNKKGQSLQSRVGLLLGTVQRERVQQQRARKTRTSLSSTPTAQDFCRVAKVHAVWEPPQQQQQQRESSSGDGSYDARQLMADTQDSALYGRVLRLASLLDLRPVGWIFAYHDDRSTSDKKKKTTDTTIDNNDDAGDTLPVWGNDVVCGAQLQIDCMKRHQEEAAKRTSQNSDNDDQNSPAALSTTTAFCTLAMGIRTGATEAFQLSDVSVQMVSEGILTNNKKDNSRFVTTTLPVLVDGQETSQLDTVLCLVNTALLTQTGLYCGTKTNSVKKRGGGLTGKVRKALSAAVDGADKNPAALLKLLCDFNVLLSLDAALSNSDVVELTRVVKKFARGQKAGTVVSQALRKKLKALLVV